MNSPASSPTPRLALAHDDIARRAQELWEKCGRPTGRDEEIWYEAERRLRGEAPTVPPTAGASSPKSPSVSTEPEKGGPAKATAKMPPLRVSKNLGQ